MFELKALKSFRDKTNPEKNFKVGETLSTDDLERVNNLVSRGICVIVSVGEKKQSGAADGSDKIKLFEKEFEVDAVKTALGVIGVSIGKTAGVAGVTKKLSELTEEQTKALSETLCKE